MSRHQIKLRTTVHNST